MKKETVVIAMQTDNNYVSYTLVAMVSIMRHCDNTRRYKFYVLISASLTQQNIDLLESVADDFANAEVRLIAVEKKFISEDKLFLGRITGTTYFRLFLPFLIEEDKCLCLDQDIAVRGDVAEIFDHDVSEYLVAGVRNIISHTEWLKNKETYLSVGLTSYENYINAGVSFREE